MDLVKEAFQKVREDISYLYQEIQDLKLKITELLDFQSNQQTNQQIAPPIFPQPTNKPTLTNAQYGLKEPNISFSTRNDGVPTDRQTNQQTNQHPLISTGTPFLPRASHLSRASEILSNLDELKKEVRLKFKRLTNQEMAVFIAIYQLEDQGLAVDYSLLAEQLKLSEVSIRDYIHKMLKKEIPLNKTKESNNRVIVSVDSALKQVASISTLQQLREL